MEKELYRKFYEIEKKHWWFVSREKIILDFLDNFMKPNKNSHILDYGCGTGSIVEALTKKYSKTTGFDFSSEAVDFCRKRGLDNILCSESFDFITNKGKFDIITLFDVLEHIDDDVSFLKSCRISLKETGLILLTVPAYQFLFGPHDKANHHIRRYIKSGLINVLEDAGFKVERISYFNTFLSPLLIIFRLLSIFSGKDESNEIPSNFINFFLKSIFSFEKKILRNITFPFGISIICFARKI